MNCITRDNDDGTFLVTCDSATHNAEVLATGEAPVPTELSLRVSSDGIERFYESFGRPDFTVLSTPFFDWMERNYPDDVDKIGFGNWESIAEARENGLLTAQFATEWGAFLIANGCGYKDGC